ncbi:MAG TPA: DUF805 domain-containing protein [Rhizomicrobium sp.]|jgi:uncharacterized membrane protein YhaH (DUF805 family)|nr:DUF805 domain-containing protein [Rhizomicrobium sp.]
MDFNKLWANFLDTLQNHYVDFNGRVGRSQFWYYILVVVGISIIASIVGSVTTRLISSLVSLALLLPNLGMGVRRLHDIGKPWFWVLVPLVPSVLGFIFLFMLLWPLAMLCWLATLAAAVLLIFWYAQPGTPGPNEYGAVPPVFAPN